MDLPVLGFIQERLTEADDGFEVRKGTAFYDLFIKPQELMLQPFVSALDNMLIGQSIRRILALTDPDSFDQENVNDLVANVYVDRDDGAYARTTVRVFYNSAVAREFTALSTEFTTGTSLSFFNEFDFTISQAQMALQMVGNLFYLDVAVRAQTQGDSYNVTVASGGITQIVNDPDAVSVISLADAIGGLPQETNTQLLTRAKNSIGVRDLETIKGINAILLEKFPALREIQAIGMGDPEMMRDIVYNAHVGGNTDVYVKTPALQVLSTNVIGIEFDTTRALHLNLHEQLLANSFADPSAYIGTPFIIPGSVVVKEDVIETSASFLTASVPPVTGIPLLSNQYIKLQVDGGLPINIKVAGANPGNTQRFEIINAINAATGLDIASPFGIDKVQVVSPTTGVTSKLQLFTPDLPRTDATTILVPSASAAGYVSGVSPAVYVGVVATTYIENFDYAVDYDNGKVIKLAGSAILSGEVIGGPVSTGAVSTGSNVFTSSTLNVFQFARIGDFVTITSILGGTGIATGDYIISEIIDNQTVKLQFFNPTGVDTSVSFFVLSNQVVVIDLDYNPLSVDVGPNVILADGVSRGIRPGRDAFTIKDVAFIDIISVEEIDPDTLEGLSVFLNLPGGYGSGGYGEGGYGAGTGGDFQFIVNRPTERFSAFEDSLLAFDPALFGKSYKITYYAATEVAQIHALSRNDLERVTGADVLPKNFVPAFVDFEVQIRRDPTNLTTPDDASLTTAVASLVEGTLSAKELLASNIIKYLENTGLDEVVVPFTMTATIVNPDGSSTIIEDVNSLLVPSPALPKQTDNFASARISHFYARDIVLTEVA